MFLAPLIIAIIVSLALAWWRVGLAWWTLATAVAIVLGGLLFQVTTAWIVTLVIFILLVGPLNIKVLRRKYISAPLLKKFSHIMPPISATEQTALDAGTVGFEGELFSGKPNWKRLLAQPKPELSAEEQAFMDGPVETLCAMIDDWQITHELADVPQDVWDYLKSNKFFGMIIPKHYGGLEFSALAHSAVLQKIGGRSMTVASLVAVPNSLGPAELLLHYGLEDQKDYYLPRLATGKEIPCFALTGPYAGSDATSIPDYGVVCKGEWQGADVLGVKLTFDKRYITLAPVATLIGLAFRMYDPDRLLGDKADLGITLAMMPRSVEGLHIGRRHFPLNNPFQNGPLHGKDVFIPLSEVIGGADMAGHGWRMLVECLSTGRALSLPSSAVGGAKMAVAATGAYARLRRQFGISIGKFEGVQEALARMAGLTYKATALSKTTAAAIDRGEQPAVASAIAKYHATEWARQVAMDGMDVHGGKGIQLGPSNYLGRSWQGLPVGVTVEGANIMTRSLMIFGQGAIRCHPYVLTEMAAVANDDKRQALRSFDKAIFGHIGFGLSNAVRAFLLAITGSRLGLVPGDKPVKAYYHKLNRYSAALALCADVAMGTLGGKLKFMEMLSARLGDVLSHLYAVSAMLKSYEDKGAKKEDRALLEWGVNDSLWAIEQAFDRVIRNFPKASVRYVLRFLVFPLGRHATRPTDRNTRQLAKLISTPSPARDAMLEWCSLTPSENNAVARLNALLPVMVEAAQAQKKFTKALKKGDIKARDYAAQLDEAASNDIITTEELVWLRQLHEEGEEFLAVDDFSSDEMRALHVRAKSKGLKPLETHF